MSWILNVRVVLGEYAGHKLGNVGTTMLAKQQLAFWVENGLITVPLGFLVDCLGQKEKRKK